MSNNIPRQVCQHFGRMHNRLLERKGENRFLL